MPQKKPAKKPASKPKKATKPKATPKPKAATTPKTKTTQKEAKSKKFYRTGEKCPASGLYTHPCIGKAGEKNTIPLSKTETFPPCRACGSVKWTLVMAA
jgi:hypothetical protein